MIRIKPHHFVDIITSFSAEDLTFKPSPYGHAVHTVSEQVLQDRDILLEMELEADDICAPCKHNINGLCDDTIDTSFRPEATSSKREWNLLIDNRWCERLKLQQGDRLVAREFCELLRDNTDDITEIYREIPVERTAKRFRNLKTGIKRFLG